MAQYAKYSTVSPQWVQFESQYPSLKELYTVGVVRRRQIYEEIESDVPPRELPLDVPEDLVTVTEFTVKARDGFDIPCRSYVPAEDVRNEKADSQWRPLVVYLHAGGFLFGDLESGDLNCRVLAKRLNASLLNVGYRLAPTWKFPHGLNDCYDAVEWAAMHASSHLKASPSTAGFVVGGISSGANFAAVIAYQARDVGLSPPITGLWVSVPVGLMPNAYDLVPQWKDELLSLEQNAENPLLTRTSLNQIEDLYGAPPSDPRMSFLLNPDHSRLPQRMYLQICGRDPLRDETFLWQKILYKESGTKSRVDLYSGLPHGFWRFLSMEVSQNWLDDLVEGIRFAVGMHRHGTEEVEIDGAIINVKGD